MESVPDLAAVDLVDLVSRRELSPVEIVEACLRRIDELDDTLRAFLSVDREGARETARRLENAARSGGRLGRLHGVPVGVKDVIPVAGQPFTLGSMRHRDQVADTDAVIVERLRREGAVIIGKTNTPEYAAYMNTRNLIRGTTLNPWDLTQSSGGSSGGSAVAVATGMATMALGTDHGGSVRFPAAVNGLVGLRPTPGLLPVYPSAWVYDEYDVHGPITHTVADARLALSVMAGRDPRVPISSGPSWHPVGAEGDGLNRTRIAWSPDLGGRMLVDPDIRRITSEAAKRLADLGAEVTEATPMVDDAIAAIRPLRMLRALIEHRERLRDGVEFDNVLLRSSIESAREMAVLDVADGMLARSRAWGASVAFFARHDLLALPTTQVAAFDKDDLFPQRIEGQMIEDALDTVLSTYVISIFGWPALSIPCGFTDTGKPVGLQLVGPPGSEGRLLRVAAAYEHSHPWSKRRPPVVENLG